MFGLFRKTPAQQAEDNARLQASLAKTRQGLFGRISALFQANEITDDTWDELEELLIQADLGMKTATGVVEKLRRRVQAQRIKRMDEVYAALKDELIQLLDHPPFTSLDEPRLLTVVLVVGVNGSGKTTSIAKLAQYYKARGRKVVLAAADTFRAAAIDQLKIWGERVGVEVIAQAPGADPGAVVFDAIRASQESRRADLLIVDTAGRLHTKYNLMKELEKVRGVCARQVHNAPHETLLVLDATTGQNAINQVEIFRRIADVSGLVMTKLDGTARGGVLVAQAAAPTIKRVVQASLKGEMHAHLKQPEQEGNRRNGYTPKQLKTSGGQVEIATPRDRDGSFEPRIVEKRQRVLNAELDQKILSMYGLGLSYSDIAAHMREIYGVETNDALIFDRDKARGFRLNIPAGTAVRFEPGQDRVVTLVALDGAREVYGFRGKIMGKL